MKSYKFYEMTVKPRSIKLPLTCPKCQKDLREPDAVTESFGLVNVTPGALEVDGTFVANPRWEDGDVYYPVKLECGWCGKVLAGGKVKKAK